MKKILLITLQDNNNIGNRLQNYALQKILEEQGAKVTNLDSGYTTVPSKKMVIKNQIKRFLGYLGSKRYAAKYRVFENSKLRRQAIASFTKEHISDIRSITYAKAFEQNWDAYDLAIVGSDQVWHKWDDDPKELPYFYLEFMPEEKRASYAASFGFDEFPAVDRTEHIKGISGMYAVSCREKSGCALVKKVTGKSAIHVLDPTLLLKTDEWREIETDISSVVEPGEKFAFVYFLGNITEEYQQFIDDIVKKYGLKIVDFFDMENENIASCGVSEFISFIDNADYILTDSFHCTVFSILFEKEFTVFKRKQEGFEKMYSRIEELLQSMGHSENAYNKICTNSHIESFKQLYQNSMEYLYKSLNN